MASIRFPSSAIPLLTLCKGHGEHFIFRTYADLINFLATYGYHLATQEGHRLPSKVEFADVPNAIATEVFENRGLFANFLIIALASDDHATLSKDDDALSKYVEKLAGLGAEKIGAQISQGEFQAKVDFLASLLTKETATNQI